MKKTSILILVIILGVSLTGCSYFNNNNNNGGGDDNGGNSGVSNKKILIGESTVRKSVQGWTVYTNPQFRFELRHPKRWEVLQPTEGGEEVTFYPDTEFLTDKYFGAIKIKSFVNWRTQYTLEQYYKEQSHDLFASEFEREEIKFKGNNVIWFKNVTGLFPTFMEKTIDVIAMNLNDRIIEAYIMDDSDQALTVFNSMSFYGTNSISNLEGANAIPDLPEAPPAEEPETEEE